MQAKFDEALRRSVGQGRAAGFYHEALAIHEGRGIAFPEHHQLSFGSSQRPGKSHKLRQRFVAQAPDLRPYPVSRADARSSRTELAILWFLPQGLRYRRERPLQDSIVLKAFDVL
jgi:hypothetical protein